jgi:deoxyribonuclease-4
MLLIGSHVSFSKETGIMGSLEEALGYNATTFMFYTGAPQNTVRSKIDTDKVKEAKAKMSSLGLDYAKLVVHAPYIINLANSDNEKYNFSISFLKQEIKRCEELEIKYLILHPGSHVGLGEEVGLENIIFALNQVLVDTNVTILLETMSGKGSELGKNFEQLNQIISKVKHNKHIGVCMDTCHMHDAGYDISKFDELLDEFDKKVGLKYLKCIHINDSKNIRGASKDRHENIGFGDLDFSNLINIIYNEKIKEIPKILETPYVEGKPPYKYEIKMIKEKKFDLDLKEKILKQV